MLKLTLLVEEMFILFLFTLALLTTLKRNYYSIFT